MWNCTLGSQGLKEQSHLTTNSGSFELEVNVQKFTNFLVDWKAPLVLGPNSHQELPYHLNFLLELTEFSLE